MKIDRFEDITSWQKAKELTIIVYKIFRESTDYGFRDQMQRASVSIMNNIAEGFERQSNVEFRRFLFIAKGSCGEVRSMIDLASELGYVSKEEHLKIHGLTIEIAKLLSGLIKTL